MAYVPLSFGRVVSGGGGSAIGTLPITSNGNYNVESYAGVAVSVSPRLQNKAVGASESLQIVEPDSGFDGLLSVEVAAIPSTYMGSAIPTMSGSVVTPTETLQTVVSANTYVTESVIMNPIPASYVVPSGTYSISANGTYGVSEYASVAVSVPGESYHSIYQSLAFRSVISADAPEVSGWINSLSTIKRGQFANQPLSGHFVFNNVSQIEGYAFGSAYAGMIGSPYASTTIEFPKVTSMEYGEFVHNVNIQSVYAPLCSVISRNAFAYCSSLTNVSFPACVLIGDYAFASCSALLSVEFSSCSLMGYGTFSSCTKLVSVNFPVCTSIETAAFSGCSSLSTINFPLCSVVGAYAFQSCWALTNAYFPECSEIKYSAFWCCSSLTAVSFPKCTSIGNGAFNSCSSLLSIYLLNSVVATTEPYPFYKTPMEGYGGKYGSIFVRASLLSQWKTATNWATYSAQMVGLTDAEIAAL